MLKHTLLIAALLLGTGEARAGLVFTSEACGGAGQPACSNIPASSFNATYSFGTTFTDGVGFQEVIVGPGGGLVCCTRDGIRLAGINSQSVVVANAFGYPIIFVAGTDPYPEIGGFEVSGPLGPLFGAYTLSGIDDSNRVLAFFDGQRYEMTPVGDADVPTPGAIWLLGAGLLATAALRSNTRDGL